MNYREVLYDLASDLGCGLRLGPDIAGMMYVEFGYVEGPDPVTSSGVTPQQAYVVGLHELGHFDYGHTQGRPGRESETWYFDNGVLHSEAEAWDFALDYAAEDLLPETLAYMRDRCLGSYLAGARAAGGRPGNRLWNGDRHHVAFTYDEPDEFFWSVWEALSTEQVTA